MNLEKYYIEKFPHDLKNLKLQKPNRLILANPEKFNMDRSTSFFGGDNWKNLESDIAEVENEYLEAFLLCLFMQTVFDLTLHEYFPKQYPAFRNKTMFPKFGHVGFGPHYQKPQKILLVPYNKQLVKFNDSQLVEEFIQLFVDECKNHLADLTPEIKVSDFISKILNDKQFQLSLEDNGTIVEVIYKKLHHLI